MTTSALLWGLNARHISYFRAVLSLASGIYYPFHILLDFPLVPHQQKNPIARVLACPEQIRIYYKYAAKPVADTLYDRIIAFDCG